MTLYLLLPPIGTPTNITICYDPISSIQYIPQIPSKSPIDDQFHMDTLRNIYVVEIDNEETDFATTNVHILGYKKKRAISSSINITLSPKHPSALTSLEEHCDFFDQGRPMIEPYTHHHTLFSTTTPVEPSNFV